MQNITVLTNDTGTQEYMINGLTPYTTYSFSVRAYSYNPGSDGSLDGEDAVLVVTTAEDCKQCDTYTNTNNNFVSFLFNIVFCLWVVCVVG